MTLLEVIISIAILGIIITPMLSLSLTSKKTNAKSEDNIQAMALAQKHFEYLKSDTCIMNNGTKSYKGINGSSRSIDDGNQLYEYDNFNIYENIQYEEKISNTSLDETDIIPTGNKIYVNVDYDKKGKYILTIYQRVDGKIYSDEVIKFDGDEYVKKITDTQSNKKIKIWIHNNSVNFHNNGKNNILVENDKRVEIIFNDIGLNIERKTDNINNPEEIDGYTYVNNGISGSSGTVQSSFIIYNISVEVKSKDNSESYIVLEGYKLQQ